MAASKVSLKLSALNVPVLLPDYCANSSTAAAKTFYQCNAGYTSYNTTTCRAYVSDNPLAVCPNCSQQLSRAMTYVVPPLTAQPVTPVSGGFVKGVMTYMVMDNLVVTPMSTISSITFLSKFGIKGIDTLEERVVELGLDEGLKLLKESLQSKAVLTTVLLWLFFLVTKSGQKLVWGVLASGSEAIKGVFAV